MDNQVFESTAERTFQYQSSLPALPVPDLHDSLNKYLHAGEREDNTGLPAQTCILLTLSCVINLFHLTGNIWE